MLASEQEVAIPVQVEAVGDIECCIVLYVEQVAGKLVKVRYISPLEGFLLLLDVLREVNVLPFARLCRSGITVFSRGFLPRKKAVR